MNELQELNKTFSKQKIKFEFNNIYYHTNSKKDVEPILNNVSGSFCSGNLTAIIGPSGAGKTTLLNILSGFKSINVRGNIFLNGHKTNALEIRKKSSYIPQELDMLEYLTPLETIKFAARLKMDSEITKFERENKIDKIITLLNLKKCENNYVSKLSGGEKKRLSIAVELLTDPPIMFFDEPTSGLDSVSSNQVLSHLSELSLNGKLIIVVIHQPSSHVITLFDDIVLLSEGNLIYNGPFNEMLSCFSSIELNCPNYYNPADFAIEIASKEYGTENLKFLKNKFMKELDSGNKCNGVIHEESKLIESNNLMILDDSKYKLYYTNPWNQFAVLMSRNFRAMWRDFITVQLRIVIHVLVGLLLGVVYWDIGSEASKILSNSACLFFFVLFIFFANAMPSVLTCPLETKVFLRESLSGWYSVTAYFFSKVFSDVQLQIICPTLFTGIAYYLTGQPMELNRILQLWGMAILTAVLGNSIGLLAGSACDMKLAVFLVPASCIPMLIFSGFFIRYRELNSYLQPLIHISYFRYSFEGFVQSIYGNNRTVLCKEIFCYYRNPKSFLKDLNMEDSSYFFDVSVILGWILVVQIGFYISLLSKVKFSQ